MPGLVDSLNLEDLKAFRDLILSRLDMPETIIDKVKAAPIILNPRMRTTAGRVNYTRWTLQLNTSLLSENPHHIEQTMAHELAHLVAWAAQGREAKGHGYAWSNIMRKLGYEPDRTHDLDVSAHRHLALCRCKAHYLTTFKRNKIKRGVKYRCKKCKTDLELK